MSKRIAVVAPWGRDAPVIVSILRSAGLEAAPATVGEMMRGIATNAYGAAIVTHEALAEVAADRLKDAIGQQPHWSDFPFVLLAPQSAGPRPLAITETLGNVIQVERPIHAATLVQCAQAALRARDRQHTIRRMLQEQSIAEKKIAELAQHLEQRVVERTAELESAYARLEQEMREKEEAEAKLRQMQTSLSQVSRVSAANMMASAIAHELNQPLAAALNYLRGAERMLRNAGAPAAAVSAVDAAARNTHHAGEIIRHLRALVSNAPVRRTVERLQDVIRDARRLLFFDPAEDCVALDDIPESASHVLVDRVQLEQVFVNLMRNAAEAMAGQPVRTISIGAERDGDCVRVNVRDYGPGFAEDPQDLSLPSFASTKPNGLGIGLSICRTIIEANGGLLALANAPGGGAVISFTLMAG